MKVIRVVDLRRIQESPSSGTDQPLVDSATGGDLRLPTRVGLARDDEALIVTFAGEDDQVVATLTGRDEDLFTEDVVEIFLAPERLEEYFEIEVNPLGALFDARVTSPLRRRDSMIVDRSWDCEGLSATIEDFSSSDSVRRVRTRVTIPFAGMGVPVPRSGDTWRGNFYRIDRGSHGASFGAWSPTGASPPDFHLPDHFGRIVFD